MFLRVGVGGLHFVERKGGTCLAKRQERARPSEALPKMRPALTPEAREGQMISLAMDLVEERLRNGTATSQETTHFLKLGSMREKLERERLKNENLLSQAKVEAMRSERRQEELYDRAIRAMQRYSGQYNEDEDDDEDEED